MKTKKKKTVYLTLIALIFLSAMPVNAKSEDFRVDNFIVPMDYPSTVDVGEIFYVHDVHGITTITSTVKFEEWLIKTKINSKDIDLNLVSPHSTEKNVIMLHNDTHKWYYAVKAYNNPKYTDSTRSYSLGDYANNFRIVNNCGKTAYMIGVTLYRNVFGAAIPSSSSERYNIGNGGVLNYNPGPEIGWATISVIVDKRWPGDPRVDIHKIIVPLKTWHTATIRKNPGYYWLEYS